MTTDISLLTSQVSVIEGTIAVRRRKKPCAKYPVKDPMQAIRVIIISSWINLYTQVQEMKTTWQ